MRTPDPTPLYGYGMHLVVAGYPVEALEVLERAADMDPRSGVIQGWIAGAHMDLANREEAETHARRAVDRGYGWSARTFAVVLLHGGNLEDASAWWGEYALADPRIPDFSTFTEPERRRELLEASDLLFGEVPQDVLLLWGREDKFLDRAFTSLQGGSFESWSLWPIRLDVALQLRAGGVG